MKWSIRIGRFAGINVFMHLSFLLLVGWVALMHWQQGQSLYSALIGVLFILSIFTCVVLHEYGHALMARRYGIPTRDIILLPIGGLARLQKMPSQPIQEFWVALAGPAVNIVIALLLFIWLRLTASWEPFQNLTVTTGPFLERLMAVNLFIVVFNMIPAFPMDGGRVLRAIMATRLPYGRATQIAVSIGKGMAVLFAFTGFFYNPFLLLIALFVWFGATQEASMVQIKSAFVGIPVRQVMIRNFNVLHAENSLSDAVELTLAGSQKDFPVLRNGSLAGMLTQSDLLNALSNKEMHSTVASVVQSDFVSVDALEMIESALAKLRDCACNTLPVVLEDRLVGLVTRDNLGEYLRFQEAINHGWSHRATQV
jgi:Zn-dependent protease/predicted transcriptional regulator